MEPFGAAAGVWSPPTPALSKSRRSATQSQKPGLDHGAYTLRSEKRTMYGRRLSEDTEFAHALANLTDDDDVDSCQSSRSSVTALDFLRQSNSPLRGHHGQFYSRQSKWTPKNGHTKKAESQRFSRSSFSSQIEGHRYRESGVHCRTRSMSSLSSLNESPYRDRTTSSSRHLTAPQTRERSTSVAQRHLPMSDTLRTMHIHPRHSHDLEHNSTLVDGESAQRVEQSYGSRESMLRHAQTQAHYLMARRASEPARGISPQISTNLASPKSISSRGEGQQRLSISSGTSSYANLPRFSSPSANESSSPNPMGPEAYNSFRVIASPGSLRSSDQIGTPGRDRSESMHHINDELYKTELCANWITTGACSYGSKCNFSHGYEDLRSRRRVENYKSQPCCDPARMGCRRCMYGKRCNYAHPGEALRRPRPSPYFDRDYFTELKQDFPKTQYPFGIYL